MNSFENKYDTIEKLIFDLEWVIKGVDFKKEINKMLISINTGHILALSLSDYPAFFNVSDEDLVNFQITAQGTGVHWPALDEDLSLKGFLKDALVMMINDKAVKVA